MRYEFGVLGRGDVKLPLLPWHMAAAAKVDHTEARALEIVDLKQSRVEGFGYNPEPAASLILDPQPKS